MPTNRLHTLNDPWRELERQAAGLLQAIARPASDAHLPVNIWTSDDEVVVEALVPGVQKDDIDLTLDDGVLTIAASRSREALADGETFVTAERAVGATSRRVRLPYAVDAGQVTATHRDGALEVRLPRAEADRPQKIAVL